VQNLKVHFFHHLKKKTANKALKIGKKGLKRK